MIEFKDEIYEEKGLKAILLQIIRHLLFIVIGGLILFLPCYIVFVLAVNSEK